MKLNSKSPDMTEVQQSDAVEGEIRLPNLSQNTMLGECFICPKVQMPKPSEKNRHFSEPLMLLVGKRKYKGEYNFHRRHFFKAGYHIENYIFPDKNVLGWKLL